MSISSIGSQTSLIVQSLVDMRGQLDDLQRQLGTGKKSDTYAGMGLERGMAVGLRARANSLVLRATQAALTASKGSGFLRQHPAQRWALQALFFLVWSCPRPAAEATLAALASPEPFACP